MMNQLDIIQIAEWVFLCYFMALHGGYLSLNLSSIISLRAYLGEQVLDALPQVYTGLEPPISVLVPAYNEQTTIAGSVRALLQLQYPDFEVIIINDGSSDSTLATLIKEFSLMPFPEAYRDRIATSEVRQFFRSTRFANLRVLDKDNGGKADSLNAGINAARYPLFCGVDADSILQPDSLQRVVKPFLFDPFVIATGGTIRVANGCEIRKGFLAKTGLPKNPWALFQIAEYLRAFLFGRLGWSPINALLIISGAFGLFRKEAVIEIGGYRNDTMGEDMELIVRLHKQFRALKKPYRITFVPDPICWTEVPEDLTSLRRQRARWQRGLAESLFMNLSLLAHPRGGAPGWVAFPFMLIFEWLGPFIEVSGYVFMFTGFFMGWIHVEAFAAFLLVAIAFGVMLSVTALLLEEISFHIYTRPRHLFILFVAVVVENFGFRQLTSLWRLIGLLQWLFGVRASWGKMRRSSKWHSNA